MKRLFGCLFAAVAAVSGLTSCDEDEKIAMNLSGTWCGEMYSCIEWREYNSTRWHSAEASVTYLDMMTDHMFGSTQGSGLEVDYFEAPCPVEYFSCEFDWDVNNGNVYFNYGSRYSDMNFEVYDFRLHYDTFKGEVGPKRDEFLFHKIAREDFDCEPFYYEKDGHRLYPGATAPSEYVHYRDAQWNDDNTSSAVILRNTRSGEENDSTLYEVRMVRRVRG